MGFRDQSNKGKDRAHRANNGPDRETTVVATEPPSAPAINSARGSMGQQCMQEWPAWEKPGLMTFDGVLTHTGLSFPTSRINFSVHCGGYYGSELGAQREATRPQRASGAAVAWAASSACQLHRHEI